MRISDNKGFKADICVMRDGCDDTHSFLDNVISNDGDEVIVSDGMACLMKAISFINRQDEFENIPVNAEDYVAINGKRFKCAGINSI